jgi:glutamine amidotransferase
MLKNHSKVGVVVYGTGNIFSICNCLQSLSVKYITVNKQSDLYGVEALILPGVGHYEGACSFLESSGIGAGILELFNSGLPVLGICLGFQLLSRSSEEAIGMRGLNLIPEDIEKIRVTDTSHFKLPHIGWNSIETLVDQSSLLRGIDNTNRIFYFSNKFGLPIYKSNDGVVATFSHSNTYAAIYEKNNLFGVQFHPEKSGDQGLKVIQNFLNK